MEAVATGSAGKSGELIPLSFRLVINEHIEVNKHNNATMPYASLLGFGDAVIPGKVDNTFLFVFASKILSIIIGSF